MTEAQSRLLSPRQVMDGAVAALVPAIESNDRGALVAGVEALETNARAYARSVSHPRIEQGLYANVWEARLVRHGIIGSLVIAAARHSVAQAAPVMRSVYAHLHQHAGDDLPAELQGALGRSFIPKAFPADRNYEEAREAPRPGMFEVWGMRNFDVFMRALVAGLWRSFDGTWDDGVEWAVGGRRGNVGLRQACPATTEVLLERIVSDTDRLQRAASAAWSCANGGADPLRSPIKELYADPDEVGWMQRVAIQLNGLLASASPMNAIMTSAFSLQAQDVSAAVTRNGPDERTGIAVLRAVLESEDAKVACARYSRAANWEAEGVVDGHDGLEFGICPGGRVRFGGVSRIGARSRRTGAESLAIVAAATLYLTVFDPDLRLRPDGDQLLVEVAGVERTSVAQGAAR